MSRTQDLPNAHVKKTSTYIVTRLIHITQENEACHERKTCPMHTQKKSQYTLLHAHSTNIVPCYYFVELIPQYGGQGEGKRGG